MIHTFLRCLIPLIFLLSATQRHALCEDGIAVLVPAFGRDNLGRNFGTVLNLKIWRALPSQTLSREPRRTGKVLWSAEPLPESSYESAEETATRFGARLVLWGSIVTFGDNALAQCLFSILADVKSSGDDVASWTVSVPNEGLNLRLSVTIPRSRYELPPIILSQEFADLYKSASSIMLYKEKGSGLLIGELGNNFTALRNEGDYIEVKTENGEHGWISAPKLNGESQVVNFVGGLMRLLQQDYSGANQLLRTVSDSSASTTLRVDSLLLQALATARLKKNPGPLVDSALRLNPYLQTATKFKIISLISQIQTVPGNERRANVLALAQQISENSYLFSPDDEWLDTAQKILSVIQKKKTKDEGMEALHQQQPQQQQEALKTNQEKQKEEALRHQRLQQQQEVLKANQEKQKEEALRQQELDRRRKAEQARQQAIQQKPQQTSAAKAQLETRRLLQEKRAEAENKKKEKRLQPSAPGPQ